MPVPLTVYDETMSGKRGEPVSLDFLTERITVRELIRERVYQEVREHNAGREHRLRMLVQPNLTEALLNGERKGERAVIDWERQFERATRAFESGRFVILVGDHQVDNLNEQILIGPTTSASFLQLVPLVGG